MAGAGGAFVLAREGNRVSTADRAAPHEYFKIGPDDEPRTRREKVAGKVTLLDRSLEEALPYLLALLGAAVFGLHLRVFVLYGKGFGAGVLTRQSLWMLIERYQTPAAISRCSTRLGFNQERRPFLTAFSNGENEVIRGVPENADPLSLLDDVFRWTR